MSKLINTLEKQASQDAIFKQHLDTFLGAQREPGGSRKSPHRRITIAYFPWIQEHPLIFESLLEFHCASVLIFQLQCANYKIKEMIHQPINVNLGEFGNYTPDLGIILSNNLLIITESKPARKFNKPYLKAYFSKAKSVIENQFSNSVFEMLDDNFAYKNQINLRANLIFSRKAFFLRPAY